MSVNHGVSRSSVAPRPQKVQVFSIARPAAGVERERRRYLVKWRVDGRDRTRSFKTRSEADRFRSALQVAARDGETFDVATWLPVRWVELRTGPTWWTWSREWLLLKWPQWSGHSRRSGVEATSALTPLLVVRDAPAPPADLGSWLRTYGYLPDCEPKGEHAEWLERWSIPLADIDEALLERVLKGNRRLNNAMHMIAITQIRNDCPGRDFYRRKIAKGKTKKEALRALKRRISDVVFRQLVLDAAELVGPGGQAGTTLQSSVTSPTPTAGSSEKATARARARTYASRRLCLTEGCQYALVDLRRLACALGVRERVGSLRGGRRHKRHRPDRELR